MPKKISRFFNFKIFKYSISNHFPDVKTIIQKAEKKKGGHIKTNKKLTNSNSKNTERQIALLA